MNLTELHQTIIDTLADAGGKSTFEVCKAALPVEQRGNVMRLLRELRNGGYIAKRIERDADGNTVHSVWLTENEVT